MTNRHRGEVSLRLADRDLSMRLTLQSLAEIEAAMGANLSEIGDRFSSGRIRAADIIALIGAALRGGGSRMSDPEIAAMLPAEALPGVIDSLAELFALTFATAEQTKGPAENPIKPQNA